MPECNKSMKDGRDISQSTMPSACLSVHIMKAKAIVASVPEQRKAIPVYVPRISRSDPMYPSTVLRLHPIVKSYFGSRQCKVDLSL